MMGLSKNEVCEVIDKLNQEKYCNVLQKMVVEISSKHGYMTQKYVEVFFDRYGEEILKPLAADVIEINNKKIEESIRTLLSK